MATNRKARIDISSAVTSHQGRRRCREEQPCRTPPRVQHGGATAERRNPYPPVM